MGDVALGFADGIKASPFGNWAEFTRQRTLDEQNEKYRQSMLGFEERRTASSEKQIGFERERLDLDTQKQADGEAARKQEWDAGASQRTLNDAVAADNLAMTLGDPAAARLAREARDRAQALVDAEYARKSKLQSDANTQRAADQSNTDAVATAAWVKQNRAYEIKTRATPEALRISQKLDAKYKDLTVAALEREADAAKTNDTNARQAASLATAQARAIQNSPWLTMIPNIFPRAEAAGSAAYDSILKRLDGVTDPKAIETIISDAASAHKIAYDSVINPAATQFYQSARITGYISERSKQNLPPLTEEEQRNFLQAAAAEFEARGKEENPVEAPVSKITDGKAISPSTRAPVLAGTMPSLSTALLTPGLLQRIMRSTESQSVR